VRKNGRMVSPDTEASSFTKAEKSIAVMPRAPRRRRPSPIEDRHGRQPGMGDRRSSIFLRILATDYQLLTTDS
jgi:hypothetical protein